MLSSIILNIEVFQPWKSFSIFLLILQGLSLAWEPAQKSVLHSDIPLASLRRTMEVEVIVGGTRI